MRHLFSLPIIAALSLFAVAPTAQASILPLNVCQGETCSWPAPAGLSADPTTGDIWIKFESVPGAGDKGHIEGRPNEPWAFFLGTFVDDIKNVYGLPFLTDMDQPIPNTQVEIEFFTDTPNDLDFIARFIEPVFVHDIHWECQVDVNSCLSAAEQFFSGTADSAFLETWQVDADLITGIWEEIPEPGTLALFGLGLAGLGLARRKRSA